MKNLLIAIGLVGVVLLSSGSRLSTEPAAPASHLRIGEEFQLAERRRQYRYLQHLKFNRATRDG